jgi:manganese/zinc/iron transport system substrate-binding protein
MIADAARIVGGPRVEVTALMGPGVDPHLYKASPGDVRVMSEADLILYNGLHLEGRLADALIRLARRRPTVQVTETIPESSLREPPEFEGHADPHVWFDVALWSQAVDRIRDALIERDPGYRDVYIELAKEHTDELAKLHEWIKAEVAQIPEPSRVLVTAHDAFGYFGRAYGLDVMAIQGISTDSEASIRDMNHLVDMLVQKKIPAVFIETSVPRKTIDALIEGCRARGHEVRIGGELFSDAMGADGTPEATYIGMMKHNVRAIVAALAPDAASKAPTATP